MNLSTLYEKEKLVQYLSKYEIFYQLSFAKLIDITKTKEYKYESDLSLILSSLYEMINQLKDLDIKSYDFNKELQKQAAMDCLQEFVNKNLLLVKNKEVKIDFLVNEINDDIFFNTTMLEMYDLKLDDTKVYWKEVLNDELMKSIKDSINSVS